MQNIHDLPEPLVKALTVERRRPVAGRISVTQLIDSPLRRVLLRNHFDEISEDASENLWSLLGRAVHYIIEKGNEDTETKIEVPVFGATLVGIIDYHKDGRVIDWKVTSKWSVIFADNKNWELQLQVYGYLLRTAGHPVNELSVYMILRDFNKREALKNPDQPQIPFQKISYPLWGNDVVEDYIRQRVTMHLEAEKIDCGASLDEIPIEYWCNSEERWSKPDKWAVMKDENVKATKICDNEEIAKSVMEQEINRTGKLHHIDFRPGEDTKCLNYCNFLPFCPYFKSKTKEEI